MRVKPKTSSAPFEGEIDQHAWCCGRLGMDRRPPPPIWQCYWNVAIDLWVARNTDWVGDDWNNDVGCTNFFYRWKAFTNDRCRIHFSQFRNALDDRDRQSRTMVKAEPLPTNLIFMSCLL